MSSMNHAYLFAHIKTLLYTFINITLIIYVNTEYDIGNTLLNYITYAK